MVFPFKDDITVFLLLGVSFMKVMYHAVTSQLIRSILGCRMTIGSGLEVGE
jgi:hypothetical protein